MAGRRAYRRFAKPLARLIDATNAVAAGDRTVRLPESSHSEFRRVEHSFNRMVEELALADQRRRTLTADVAHELRTPLQIIQGNLEGVLDGVYQPTPDHIEATLAETRQLARLVEDLRVLSQAEAGQLPMAREPVEIGELVQDVATSFSGQAQAAGIDLTTSVEPPSIAVLGDSGRLDQVLSNIVANALRHTPRGGQIDLAARSDDGMATIVITDTGEGIPPEELPFIFDRFWRGDRARTRATGGSGLGLAIARELVLAHGGTIEAVSTPGVGSSFTIHLSTRLTPEADEHAAS
jgi:signal transduction histidine kinase